MQRRDRTRHARKVSAKRWLNFERCSKRGYCGYRIAGTGRRFGEMSKLMENAARFRDGVSIQRDRLAVATWLHSLEDASHVCPVCASSFPILLPNCKNCSTL